MVGSLISEVRMFLHMVITTIKQYHTKLKPAQSVLQELLFQMSTHTYMSTIKGLIEKQVISQTVTTKMWKTGLGWSHLQLAYKRGGDEGVHVALKEKVAGQVRVTNNQKSRIKLQPSCPLRKHNLRMLYMFQHKNKPVSFYKGTVDGCLLRYRHRVFFDQLLLFLKKSRLATLDQKLA